MVEEEVGHAAVEDDDLDVGIVVEVRTIVVQPDDGLGEIRFAGGFAKVILAIFGVGRSRLMVLGWVIVRSVLWRSSLAHAQRRATR